MTLSDAVIIALISSGLTFLAAWFIQRPRSMAESEKLRVEKNMLLDQNDRDEIVPLMKQLAEARASNARYRARLRMHGIDPDSDTGPLEAKS